MSLFFEDVEVKEKTVVTESLHVEDVTGLVSATLESEMAWHNITTEIMQEEFQAVITEDEDKAESSKEAFFKKVIKFFEDLWKKFVSIIQPLVNRLQIQFVNGEKFAKAREAKIKAYKGDAKVQVYDWKIKDIGSLAEKFSAERVGSELVRVIQNSASEGKAFTADEIAKRLGFESLSAMDTKLVEQARSAQKVEKTVDSTLGAQAFANIMSGKKVLAQVKAIAGGTKKVVDAGRKEALDGLKEKSAENKKKKVASTSTARSASTVLNKVINVMIKLVLESYADSMKVARVASSAGGQEIKDAKKAEKAKGKEKEEAKNESLFDLSLEDFDSVNEDVEETELTLEDLEDISVEI